MVFALTHCSLVRAQPASGVIICGLALLRVGPLSRARPPPGPAARAGCGAGCHKRPGLGRAAPARPPASPCAFAPSARASRTPACRPARAARAGKLTHLLAPPVRRARSARTPPRVLLARALCACTRAPSPATATDVRMRVRLYLSTFLHAARPRRERRSRRRHPPCARVALFCLRGRGASCVLGLRIYVSAIARIALVRLPRLRLVCSVARRWSPVPAREERRVHLCRAAANPMTIRPVPCVVHELEAPCAHCVATLPVAAPRATVILSTSNVAHFRAQRGAWVGIAELCVLPRAEWQCWCARALRVRVRGRVGRGGRCEASPRATRGVWGLAPTAASAAHLVKIVVLVQHLQAPSDLTQETEPDGPLALAHSSLIHVHTSRHGRAW